jgi:hypothetical protein
VAVFQQSAHREQEQHPNGDPGPHSDHRPFLETGEEQPGYRSDGHDTGGEPEQAGA